MKKLYFLLFILSFYFLCNGQNTVLHNFNGTLGEFPGGEVTISGNKLYGMTLGGGVNNKGMVFSCDTNGNFYKDILDFNGTNGYAPYGSLIISGKKLYGMTSMGDTVMYCGAGMIFSIDTNGSNYKILFETNCHLPNPSSFYGSLILSGNRLYGMGEEGGAHDSGCVFSIDTNGTVYKDIFDFNGSSGQYPYYGALTLSGNVLFGVTSSGGAYNDGVVFSVDTNGNNFKDLHDFNGTNGLPDCSSLVVAGNELYGMAYEGGANNLGLVFSIDTNGSGYKDMFDFNGTNGKIPYGALTPFGNKLLGMSHTGGTNNKGLVFSIDTNGTNYSDLLDFNGTNGYAPNGSSKLTLSGKKFYGMTAIGGTYNDGVIFSLDTNSISTSINQLVINNCNASVYPNPSNGILSTKLTGVGYNSIKVFDLFGREVYTQLLDAKQSDLLLTINAGNLSNGVYIIQIANQKGNICKRVVIEK